MGAVFATADVPDEPISSAWAEAVSFADDMQ